MRVRLTRKLANAVDGVDLSHHREGDMLELPRPQAELLIAEGWGQLVSGHESRATRRWSPAFLRADAGAYRLNLERLRHLGDHIEDHLFEPTVYRRIEDRLRDELHEARARIVKATAGARDAPVGPSKLRTSRGRARQRSSPRRTPRNKG